MGLGSMEGLTPPGVPETTPGYKGSLEGDYTGIAEVFARKGMTPTRSANGIWEKMKDNPRDLGFDQNFTLRCQPHYSDGHRLFDLGEEGEPSTPSSMNATETLDSLPEDFFATRSYTDEMIQLVDQSAESEQPFFGYLGYTAPHDPLHVENKELIDHYLEVYQDDYNYEELREERIQRMADLGLIDSEAETRWPEQTPQWDSLTPEQQEDMAYRMAVYAAVSTKPMRTSDGWLIASRKRENTTIHSSSWPATTAPTPKTITTMPASMEPSKGGMNRPTLW